MNIYVIKPFFRDTGKFLGDTQFGQHCKFEMNNKKCNLFKIIICSFFSHFRTKISQIWVKMWFKNQFIAGI
jgi:hypothetical protein